MSVAVNISALPHEGSLTVRQFRLAVLVAFLAVGVGCLIYLAEKYVFDVNKRFVENPTELMMRAFGVAHFLVGWLFLVTSRAFQSWRSMRRLACCSLLGGVFCLAYASCGATRNPIMVMLFYSFFVVHEVRDQADLFLAYGDGPHSDARILGLLRCCVCLLFVTVLASAYLVNGLLFDRHDIANRAAPQLLLGGITLVALCTIAVFFYLLRSAVRVHGSLAQFTDAYRPLLMVYGGILTVLLFGSLLGSVGFNLIILIHVTSWLVFVRFQLARRSKAPQRIVNPCYRLWSWVRANPAGFAILHLGLVVIVLVLLALRVYLWQRSGVVSVLLSSSSFPYWSFMHIAIAFARTR